MAAEVRGGPTIIEVLNREMRLRNYSPKTVKAYRSCLRAFIRYLSPVHPRDATVEGIRKFLIHLMDERHFSASSVNQVINALRFLYVEMYHRPFQLGEIPRPKRERGLPVVFSRSEVLQLLEGIGNLKHRTILMLVPFQISLLVFAFSVPLVAVLEER